MENVEISLKLQHKRILHVRGRSIEQTVDKFDRLCKQKGVKRNG